MPARIHPSRALATRSSDLGRAAMRAAGQLALTALVAFHAWLLWAHLVGGRPLDLQTAARWLVSVGVLVGFRALRRRGVSLFWGRRAVVLWLLVVLIHCHAVWDGKSVSLEVGIPESAEILLQLSTPLMAVVGFLLTAVLLIRLQSPAPAWSIRGSSPCVAGLLAPALTLRFLPRPPPIA